jgi:hypothetical protein
LNLSTRKYQTRVVIVTRVLLEPPLFVIVLLLVLVIEGKEIDHEQEHEHDYELDMLSRRFAHGRWR